MSTHRSIDRAVALSVGRLIALSLDWPIGRSLEGLADLWIGRLLACSVVRAVARWIA